MSHTSSPLVHPPVRMPETRRYKILELLRVDGPYVVAYLRCDRDESIYDCIGKRWVDLEKHTVFPQSRGFATWMEMPKADHVPYLQLLLSAPGTDKRAVLRVLEQLVLESTGPEAN